MLKTSQTDPRTAELASSLEILRSRLSGELLTPVDATYDDARSVWNGMIDRRPLAICRCRSVDDVIATVRCAQENGLPVSIRAGAHNVAGHAVCDGGLTIDLSSMRGIDCET